MKLVRRVLSPSLLVAALVCAAAWALGLASVPEAGATFSQTWSAGRTFTYGGHVSGDYYPRPEFEDFLLDLSTHTNALCGNPVCEPGHWNFLLKVRQTSGQALGFTSYGRGDIRINGAIVEEYPPYGHLQFVHLDTIDYEFAGGVLTDWGTTEITDDFEFGVRSFEMVGPPQLDWIQRGSGSTVALN